MNLVEWSISQLELSLLGNFLLPTIIIYILIKESILIKECSLKSHLPVRVSNRAPIVRAAPT